MTKASRTERRSVQREVREEVIEGRTRSIFVVSSTMREQTKTEPEGIRIPSSRVSHQGSGRHGCSGPLSLYV